MKTFAIGDIHGSYKALLQCVEQSGIDKEKDKLIVLGDVVDGWPEIKKVVDELLTFKNLVAIRGNHDQWFMDWAKTGKTNLAWLQQGGYATFEDYKSADEASDHLTQYFDRSLLYYLDEKRRLFVHGGLDWKKPLDENDDFDFMWDRHAYQTALQWESISAIHPTEPKDYFKNFKEVWVGHTTTQWSAGWNYTPGTEPVFASNLINLDTGGGWSGKLTIMDVDSKEHWQSDLVPTLYPDVANARR